MKISSFFTITYLSFFSKRLYQSVPSKLPGYGLLFLLLLNLFCELPLSVYWFSKIASIDLTKANSEEIDYEPLDKDNINYILRNIIAQAPLITIDKGLLSIKDIQPFYINHPITHEPLVIIDTTGKVTHLNDNKAILLITKKDILVRNFGREPMHYYISELVGKNVDSQILDHSRLESLITQTKKYMLFSMPFIFYPMLVITALFHSLIRATFFSVSGIILGRLWQMNLSWQDSLKLAIVSSTPAMILQYIGGLGLYSILPYQIFELIIFATSAGYYYFAIKNYRELTLSR